MSAQYYLQHNSKSFSVKQSSSSLSDFTKSFSKIEAHNDSQTRSTGRIPLYKAHSVIGTKEQRESDGKESLLASDTDSSISQNDNEQTIYLENDNKSIGTINDCDQEENSKQKPTRKHVFHQV